MARCLWMALAATGLMLAALPACAESREAVATSVVTEWVIENTNVVADEVVQAVIGDVPVISQIAGDALAHQVRDNVTWDYADPVCSSDGRCEVIATASVSLEVDIPVVGEREYVASLPFAFTVDTEARAVERWFPRPLDASVEERRE